MRVVKFVCYGVVDIQERLGIDTIPIFIELEDAIFMRIQALFIRKTVLEFFDEQHFADCGCPLLFCV